MNEPTDLGVIAALGTNGGSQLDTTELVADLAQRAARDGLLDIGYRTVDSPVGPLLVAATEIGLVRVAFEVEDHARALGELARVVSPRILRSTHRTEQAARQLGEYFAGDRTRFALRVDLQLVEGFRRQVISYLSTIGYGSTASYAAVATAVGRPRAVRAVGSACAHNPMPVVIPCHRVVRSDGSVGDYLGGAQTKAALLQMEGSR